MRRRFAVGGLIGVALLGAAHGTAGAAPTLRVQVAQRGDFALIGNTLAHECAAGTPAPVVGTVGNCGVNTADTAPDVHWRADSPADGQAEANTSIGVAQARSTAVLNLPAGATVTHAYLYWAASASVPDLGVTLERPGTFGTALTGAVSGTASLGVQHYQSFADVTALVQLHGEGPYRVSGVDALALANLTQASAFAGWWMVVFYALDADPPRNLALFDGLDAVLDGAPQDSTISGFVVPTAGFGAKLGVIAFEGDNQTTGDALLWDASVLSDALNPADNFFNSTRSLVGAPLSLPGELPQLTGTAQSMSGVDFDVVQIPPNLLSAGQSSATVTAQSSADTYLLGGLVTSISTLLPDLSTSTKSVSDVNGGGVSPGDVLEYTIVVTNTGDDTAANVVLADPIPAGVTYVPGSIAITQGPNMGPKTDALADDQGEYDAAASTVRVRLGAGADGASGGTLAIGESTSVRFQVTVDAGAQGTIANQAVASASSPQGGPTQDFPTDGNGGDPGAPPTEVLIDSDGDGLGDLVEQAGGTDPNDADSDDDGAPDGAEPQWDVDSDGDGLINALDPDSDDDGLYDGTELGLDCAGPDTAPGHCTADADGGATTTDPLAADTDGGGKSDGTEDANLNGAPDAGETDPTAGHGADDSAATDTDGDGLGDALEATLGSNPNDADSDDDGVADGGEPNPADDTDGDGLINVLDADSDDDALFDGTELGLACEKPDTNTALGHCIADGDQGATLTSPLDPDTDDGGALDGSEDPNRNGALDAGETDPTAGNGGDDASVIDSDGDGLGDLLEMDIGSSPNDQDSDDDGLLDGDEPNPSDDHDGDQIANVNDEDSDGDGLFDGTEVGNGCSNADTDPTSGTCVADADGGATTTHPLDPDTDDGGVTDGDEDADHDGAIDPDETDPNDGSDDGTKCTGDSDCGDAQSGMVCDDETKDCVEGCRGMGGNGCPEGEVCSSADATIGTCGDGAGGGGATGGGGGGTGGSDAEAAVVQGGGCVCGLAAGEEDGERNAAAWGLVVAGACAAVLRRRRRGRGRGRGLARR